MLALALVLLAADRAAGFQRFRPRASDAPSAATPPPTSSAPSPSQQPSGDNNARAPAMLTAEEVAELRERVVVMFDHAYTQYKTHAFPADELRPLACRGRNVYGGLLTTVIDSLDSLYVFGHIDEFHAQVRYVVDHFDSNRDVTVSVFETNIRVVGGLLSAHLICVTRALEGGRCLGGAYRDELLAHAAALARRLLPAFATPTGLPANRVNLASGSLDAAASWSSVADCGSFLLEFGLLSELTDDPTFVTAARRAAERVFHARSALGLVGTNLDVQTGEWRLALGGVGSGVDSFFEYLLKWSLMADDASSMDMFRTLYKAAKRHYKVGPVYWQANMNTGERTAPHVDGLQAYWPGLQTLLGDAEQTREARESVLAYVSLHQKHGFLPEITDVLADKLVDPRYELRPELAESLYLVYRATGDPLIQLLGAELVNALETHARHPCGYTGFHDVRTRTRANRMESFFLAETLKYLFLLFDSRPLYAMQFPGAVLSTEAHPLWLPSRARAGANDDVEW